MDIREASRNCRNVFLPGKGATVQNRIDIGRAKSVAFLEPTDWSVFASITIIFFRTI